MKTILICRHRGALQWALSKGIENPLLLDHYDPRVIDAGDVVIGNLPVPIVADINVFGATYRHLMIFIPDSEKSKDLSMEEMKAYGARLETYRVKISIE